MQRYRVKLSAEERQELKTMVSRGRAAAYQQTHGRVLLLSDEAHADGAMKDEAIARVLQIGRATVERVRRRCVEEGIEAALGRKEQLNRRPKRLERPRGSPPRIQYGAGSGWPAENRPFGSAQGRLRRASSLKLADRLDRLVEGEHSGRTLSC